MYRSGNQKFSIKSSPKTIRSMISKKSKSKSKHRANSPRTMIKHSIQRQKFRKNSSEEELKRAIALSLRPLTPEEKKSPISPLLSPSKVKHILGWVYNKQQDPITLEDLMPKHDLFMLDFGGVNRQVTFTFEMINRIRSSLLPQPDVPGQLSLNLNRGNVSLTILSPFRVTELVAKKMYILLRSQPCINSRYFIVVDYNNSNPNIVYTDLLTGGNESICDFNFGLDDQILLNLTIYEIDFIYGFPELPNRENFEPIEMNQKDIFKSTQNSPLPNIFPVFYDEDIHNIVIRRVNTPPEDLINFNQMYLQEAIISKKSKAKRRKKINKK